MATLQFFVPDMGCNVCVEIITQAIQALNPDATINADIQVKQVTITTTAAPILVKQAIATHGYTIALS